MKYNFDFTNFLKNLIGIFWFHVILFFSAEIDRLGRLDGDDLEVLRQKRMAGMKKQQAKKQEWLSNGHGNYEEIPEEKEFFNVTKKSENVVVHFYKDDSFR